MTAKLTLSVDAAVVAAAKRYAADNATSVSALVEAYLSAVTQAAEAEPDPPVLARLRGALASGDPADHKAWLAEKYGL